MEGPPRRPRSSAWWTSSAPSRSRTWRARRPRSRRRSGGSRHRTPQQRGRRPSGSRDWASGTAASAAARPRNSLSSTSSAPRGSTPPTSSTKSSCGRGSPAGRTSRIAFRGSETVDVAQIADRAKLFPWALTTPVLPGDEAQTYRISISASTVTSVSASDTRHILLRPTDAAGADFGIESVRLVFRKEHLAAIPSGVGWQGLGEMYRESIVSRSPERLRFGIRVPERAILNLAVGTVAEGPVTFKISAGEKELSRTLTTPNRWEELTLDLSALAGRDATITLSLEAESDGSLGIWGAPAVRSRGEAKKPTGIVLFFIDTLRRDHLDAYGFSRETAPQIRRLADKGVLFQDAIAQGAWTKVSVPSILTSTYPTSNGIYEMNHRMPAAGVTLAEALREAGYATWATSSGGFTGRASNLHQGVEVLHEAGSLPSDDRGKDARFFVDRFLPWLEAHQDVPFFAMISRDRSSQRLRAESPVRHALGPARRQGEAQGVDGEGDAAHREHLHEKHGTPHEGRARESGNRPDSIRFESSSTGTTARSEGSTRSSVGCSRSCRSWESLTIHWWWFSATMAKSSWSMEAIFTKRTCTASS